MSPRVIGLDISLTKTGIALPGGETLVSKSAVRKIKGRTYDTRLRDLYDEVYALITFHGVTHAIIEDLPVNGMGAGGTGQAHGVVRLALQQRQIPFVKVVPATLKKYATGAGRADKEAMASAMPPEPRVLIGNKAGWDDQVDAWWLRHMGLTKLGLAPYPDRTAPAIVKWEGWGL